MFDVFRESGDAIRVILDARIRLLNIRYDQISSREVSLAKGS
jgi:hypothetical protein